MHNSVFPRPGSLLLLLLSKVDQLFAARQAEIEEREMELLRQREEAVRLEQAAKEEAERIQREAEEQRIRDAQAAEEARQKEQLNARIAQEAQEQAARILAEERMKMRAEIEREVLAGKSSPPSKKAKVLTMGTSDEAQACSESNRKPQ